MARIAIAFALLASLLAWQISVVHARQPVLSMAVFFIDTPKVGEESRMWIQITNRTSSTQVICRSGWGYTWLPADQNEPPTIAAHASFHGCGDDDHDPFWLLLPGESRFDSHGVRGPADPGATLDVSVELERRQFGTSPAEPMHLTWSGRVADAVAAGVQLRKQAPGLR